MKADFPLVAIVGRANVGKSTLFNRLSKKRLAIVDPSPGVTRDFLENLVEIGGQPVKIVDTGGLEVWGVHPQSLQREIEQKVWEVLKEARVALFVVDGRTHLTGLEAEIAARLRKEQIPIILVVNKREGVTHQLPPTEFLTLGLDPVVQISALHGDGIANLKRVISQEIQEQEETSSTARQETPTSVAIVGKPNVGKSTLYNRLLGYHRSLVSVHPGTTRDAVGSTIHTPFGAFRLIDTAGLSRGAKADKLDFYASRRTEGSIEKSSICLLVVDPIQGITRQDKRIAAQIVQNKKGCIVFVNKMDLVRETKVKESEIKEWVRQDLNFLYYSELVMGYALEETIASQIFPLLGNITTRYYQRLKTSFLNKTIKEELNQFKWALPSGKFFQIYYIFQEQVAPPRFILHTNFSGVGKKEEMLKKWIEKFLRETMDWKGVPLEISLSGK